MSQVNSDLSVVGACRILEARALVRHLLRVYGSWYFDMSSLGSRVFLLFLAIGFFGCSSGSGSSVSPPPLPPVVGQWSAPSCVEIGGSSSVAFSTNTGQSYVLPQTPLNSSSSSFASGIAPIQGTPNTLFVTHNGSVLVSSDAGCTWSQIAAISLVSSRLAVGTDASSVYAWQINESVAYQVSNTGSRREFSLPTGSAKGFSVSMSNGQQIRIVDRNGLLFQSMDGGRNWTAIGVPAPLGAFQFANMAAFSFLNIDHVFVGSQDSGYVSMDGGINWTVSTGIAGNWPNFNVTTAQFSEASSDVLWMVALGVSNSTSSMERAIFRSADGGISFENLLQHGVDGLVLQNEPVFDVSSSNPNKIVIVVEWRDGACGVSTFSYDSDQIALIRNDSLEIFSAGSVSFSPADDSITYLGLQSDPDC